MTIVIDRKIKNRYNKVGDNMKKKKKTSILPTLLGLIFIIGIIVVLFTWNPFAKKENKLIELGYTKEEVTFLEQNLTAEQLLMIQDRDYIEELIPYMKEENFAFDSLDRYLEYGKKNQISSKTETVTLVNLGIDTMEDIEYDPILIQLMNGTYYIKNNLKRYVNYYQKDPKKSVDSIITNVNSNLDYAFYTNTQKADTSKGNLILVNKYYQLSEDFVPEELVTFDTKYGYANKATKTTYEAYKKMWEAAKQEGLILFETSPYRSYQTQAGLYQRYVNESGKEEADTFSARPGFSEHQTGLAIDLVSDDSDFDTFEYTKEYQWMQENCYKYGFILRYPKGKEYITGYIYEPWHYRYVGVEVATAIHDTGLTYEEYYAYYVNGARN